AKRLRTDFIFSKSNTAAGPPSGGSPQVDLDPHTGKPFVCLPTGTERTGAKDDNEMDSPSGPKMSSVARVEILNTGTELLFGSVINTHLSFLAQQLFPIGLRVQWQSTIPDGDAIRDAITESARRCDVILVTGGLGPTTDDITREIVSELTGRPLRYDDSIFQKISERFRKRGIKMTDRTARQAYVPEGAAVLPNDHGTAPGLHIPARNGFPHLFLLPGPPRELRPMFNTYALPILRSLARDQ